MDAHSKLLEVVSMIVTSVSKTMEVLQDLFV